MLAACQKQQGEQGEASRESARRRPRGPSSPAQERPDRRPIRPLRLARRRPPRAAGPRPARRRRHAARRRPLQHAAAAAAVGGEQLLQLELQDVDDLLRRVGVGGVPLLLRGQQLPQRLAGEGEALVEADLGARVAVAGRLGDQLLLAGAELILQARCGIG